MNNSRLMKGIIKGNNFSSQGEGDASFVTEKTEIKTKVIVNILNTIITASLFLIFLGLPLFFLNTTYQGIIFEKQIYFYFLLLLALVAFTAKGIIIGELKIRRTPLDVFILIFWLVYLLATIFSIDRWHSFWGFFGDPSRGFINITALIIAYYLIISHFNEKRFKLFISAIIISGIIMEICLALEILGVKFLPEKIISFVPLSLIGSISGTCVFLSVFTILLITLVFIVQRNKNKKRFFRNIQTIVYLIGIILGLFLFLSLYNFLPWHGLLIGMGVFIIYILSRVVRPLESWIWLPMVVFMVLMIVLMIGPINIVRINLPVEISPAYNISFDIAKEALKDKFFLGSGPATYGYSFSRFHPQDFNQNYFYNLRFYQGTGFLAEATASLGGLGIFSLLLLILALISVGFYLLTREKELNKLYSLGFFSGFIVLIVCALTIRFEGTLVIWGSLFTTLTLAVLLWESRSEERYLDLTIKTSSKYALVLAFIFMVVSVGVAYLFVFFGKALTADVYAGSAIREKEISEEGSIRKLTRAINLYRKEGRYFTRLGQEYMVLANTEMLKNEKERNIDALQFYLNRSIAAAATGKNMMKSDILAVEALAQIYENAGFYVTDSLKLAEDVYKEAQNLEPYNPDYFVKIGQIKLNQAAVNQNENEKKSLVNEAKDLFQESINKKNNFPIGYYQLALAQEALGEIDAAIDNMNKAFQLERSSIVYAFNLGRLYQVRGKDEDNKIAENLFKQILGINDKEINTHFSLGLLYEKTGRKSEAISEYNEVLNLLPDDLQKAKDRVQEMINNLQNGISNFAENTNIVSEEQSTQ